MQRLQGEGRVAHPGEAVVPVALAARRLGQRGRERRDGRPGRHVGEALDRQRRALDRIPEAVVGQPRPPEPAAPVVASWRPAARWPRRCPAARPGPRPTRASSRAARPARGCAGREPVRPRFRAPCRSAAGSSGRRRWRRPCGGRRRPATTPRACARSRRPARRRARPRPCPSRHSTVRTSMWSPSSSAGGRVWGVTSSSPLRGAHGQRVADMTQPAGVFQVVASDVRPGLVDAGAGYVDPEGPEAKGPGLAVEQGAEHARRVEARHAEPIDRSIGRDKRARVAVGEERVVGDRRERRGRGGALCLAVLRSSGGRLGAVGRLERFFFCAFCRAHDGTHGPCQRAVTGDELVGGRRAPRSLGVRVDRRGRVEKRLHDPPGLLDAILPGEARAVADHRRVEQHLVRRGSLPPLFRELHVELICSGRPCPHAARRG